MEEMASPRLASPFHHLHRLDSSKPTNTSLPLPCLTLGLLSSSSSPMRASRNQPARFSVDVSKEDKPLSSQPEDSSSTSTPQPAPPVEEVKKLDLRRLEEPDSTGVPVREAFRRLAPTARPPSRSSRARAWRSQGSRRTSSSGREMAASC